MSQPWVNSGHDFSVLVCVTSLDGAHRELRVLVQHVVDCVGRENVLNVGVGHAHLRETPVAAALLSIRGFGCSSEDTVQLLECTLGPDDEAAQVSSGSHLQDRQGVDVAEVKTGHVSESSELLSLTVVYNERSTFLLESAVSVLSDASSDFAGCLRSVDVVGHTELSEQLVCLLGLLYGDINVEHKGKLSESVDPVASALYESGQSGCTDSGCNSVSALVKVGLSGPPSPDSLGVLHVSSSARVGECSGTRGVGSSSFDSGYTSDSSSWSPRLC